MLIIIDDFDITDAFKIRKVEDGIVFFDSIL